MLPTPPGLNHAYVTAMHTYDYEGLTIMLKAVLLFAEGLCSHTTAHRWGLFTLSAQLQLANCIAEADSTGSS
jgi:hypothetical protein